MPLSTPPPKNVGEDVGKKEPHTLLMGMQASTTTVENNIKAS
jgi:hypothetical protein